MMIIFFHLLWLKQNVESKSNVVPCQFPPSSTSSGNCHRYFSSWFPLRLPQQEDHVLQLLKTHLSRLCILSRRVTQKRTLKTSWLINNGLLAGSSCWWLYRRSLRPVEVCLHIGSKSHWRNVARHMIRLWWHCSLQTHGPSDSGIVCKQFPVWKIDKRNMLWETNPNTGL